MQRPRVFHPARGADLLAADLRASPLPIDAKSESRLAGYMLRLKIIARQTSKGLLKGEK